VNRTALAVGLAVLVALGGCSAFSGGSSGGAETTASDEQVEVADAEAGATGVNQTLRITVDEAAAGDELTEVGATYPRDEFVVDSAQHDAILLGVDTDGDGEIDRQFDESHISGVNNNAYSFDVTVDTDYTLQQGDVVVLRYPAVDNPDEPGTYTVETRLNGAQAANASVTIE